MSLGKHLKDRRLHLADPARPLVSLCGIAISSCLLGTKAVAVLVEPSVIRLEVAAGPWLGPGCPACAEGALRRALGPRAAGLPMPLVQLMVGSATPVTGATLRARRTRAGLTRAELADMAGVAEATIRNIETQRHRATEKTLAKLRIVAALCVTVNRA